MKEIKITGTLVGGLFGLMAFLLALSINTVVNQHNDRKAMVVTEANAIGTAYLRAGFLEEPDRSLARDLLREYVEVRLEGATDLALLATDIARSEAIQNQLWRQSKSILGWGNSQPQGLITVSQQAMEDLLHQISLPGS